MSQENIFHRKKIFIASLLYFLFALQPAVTLAKGTKVKKPKFQSESIYTRIAKQALLAHSEMKNIFEFDEEMYDPKKPKYNLSIKQLSEFEKRNIFFSIFHKYGKKCQKQDTKVFIDEYWKDLDFFRGPIVNKMASVFNQINHTKTIPGEIVLQRRLTQSTTDVQDLKNWQAINKELSKKKKLTSLLGAKLKTFSESQNHLLTFWQKENPFNEEIFKKVYFSNPGLKNLNQNPAALETRRRWNNFIDLGFKPFGIPITVLAMLSLGARNIEYDKKYPNGYDCYPIRRGTSEYDHAAGLCRKLKFSQRAYSKKHNCYYRDGGAGYIQRYEDPSVDIAYPVFFPPRAIWALIVNSPELIRKTKDYFIRADRPVTEKLLFFGGLSALLGISVYMAYNGINAAKLENNITTYLQERLIGVSSAIRSMKEVTHLVKTNKTLSAHISTKEIDKLDKQTLQLTKLINLLMTKTFTGKASFFSLSGRVLAAYKIMNEVKNQLAPAFEELGLIDAHYSCAQLRKKFEKTNHTYCYPKYTQGVKQPYIKAKDFWFPGLLNDPNLKHVVTNSIGMGYLTNEARNILLTGPNAGGKSTILKGLVTMIIMAQTLGIAPAAQLEFTPFSKVQTYINIVDSAAEGVSTFRAELNRARDLLNTIIGLAPREFSFTIFDEVFRGTNPEEAIQGSAYLAAVLGKMPNSMSIIATHFGLLTKLEELLPGIYTNRQVTAIKKETHFHYPFTWKPGVSKHKIATDLMRFENLKDPDGLSMSERFGKLIDEYGIR
jgi:hypothetical protein